VVATVIVLPALLLAFWLVLQYALVAHVRHVVQTAAQDAALAAASGSGDPDAVANDLIGDAVGSLTSGVRVAPAVGPERATVTLEADVLQVFPIGSFDVTVTASAPIERFVPQPARP
jgi:Flp pilus assembly protein TadG